jgi:hypothetical protein
MGNKTFYLINHYAINHISAIKTTYVISSYTEHERETEPEVPHGTETSFRRPAGLTLT